MYSYSAASGTKIYIDKFKPKKTEWFFLLQRLILKNLTEESSVEVPSDANRVRKSSFVSSILSARK